jgi:hypothetical protein
MHSEHRLPLNGKAILCYEKKKSLSSGQFTHYFLEKLTISQVYQLMDEKYKELKTYE